MTSDDLADLALNGPIDSADVAVSRDADAVVAALARLVAPVGPPPNIRARLLEQVRSEPRMAAYLQRADEAVWEDYLLPGLTRRVLFSDPVSQRVTMQVRLAPGGRLPAHPHNGVEEVFMLEGELHGVGGSLLRIGDYQRSEAGTMHVEQWTVAGCMALMVVPIE